VLVGNKKDLEKDRVVSTSEGEALAKKHDVPFIETSALTNENVDKAYQMLLLQCTRGLQITYQSSNKKCSIM
jgi:Ras-related protein Rab-8A